MNTLLKYAAIGAAVAVGLRYATKKRADGTSLLSDITEKAPEWINKAKKYGNKMMNEQAIKTPKTRTNYQAY